MPALRYALSPGGVFVHVLPAASLVALCGDSGQRGYRRKKRCYWFVLTAKCPGPVPKGRKVCAQCEEAMKAR